MGNNCGSLQKTNNHKNNNTSNKNRNSDNKDKNKDTIVLGKVPEQPFSLPVFKSDKQSIHKTQQPKQINDNKTCEPSSANINDGLDIILPLKLPYEISQNKISTHENKNCQLNSQIASNTNNFSSNVILKEHSFSEEKDNLPYNYYNEFEYSIESEEKHNINKSVNDNYNINNNNNNINEELEVESPTHQNNFNPYLSMNELNLMINNELDGNENLNSILNRFAGDGLMLYNPFVEEVNKNVYIFNWVCHEKEEGLYFWKLHNKEEIKGIYKY